ncbi:type 2 lactosamine alpha-2,3-sialyltransferase isoform X3 [Taeniopygia guttata]|uniref:type 2 lactosamine alpha-2,3-sialyltransferase isoform X3 n=2 Tax=Taeniopygia guttata TaxID=59729 RepID=UPI003BB91039
MLLCREHIHVRCKAAFNFWHWVFVRSQSGRITYQTSGGSECLSVMKRIILVFILAAAVMYGILHGNLWRNNFYWLPPTAVERRNALDTCLLKPAFESLLGVDKIYPFLCANDFIRVAEFQGSNKFELPYGIKRAEQFFRLALSRLQNCGLSSEEDSIPCRRCVVVGNGGVLRNKTLGEKIDSYDVIIRMNNGPVIGYEEDVGRRTTFRLSYPESIFSDPIHYDPNTTVVLIVFKPRDLKWLWEILGGQKISAKGFWKKPALNMIYKSSQIRILDPSITRKTAYEWLHFPTRFPKKEKPKHPTTGLIAITLAFHICHEVHLAGFKYDFTDRNSSLHYYGNETMSQMMQPAEFLDSITLQQRCFCILSATPLKMLHCQTDTALRYQTMHRTGRMTYVG